MTSTDLPVLNARLLFPRVHPSVWMAVGLAAASLLLGPPVAVPAIWLARQVRREIVDHRGRLTGGRLVAFAGATAWSSSFAWLTLTLTVVVVALPAVTYLVALMGLGAGLLVLSRRWSRWLAAATVVCGLSAAALGTNIHDHFQRERAVTQLHACEVARDAAAAAWSENHLQTARREYERAVATCMGDEARIAAVRLHDLDARDAHERLVQTATDARGAAEVAAGDSARRERVRADLRARFAAVDVTASERLSQVHRLARGKRWDKAQEQLKPLSSDSGFAVRPRA